MWVTFDTRECNLAPGTSRVRTANRPSSSTCQKVRCHRNCLTTRALPRRRGSCWVFQFSRPRCHGRGVDFHFILVASHLRKNKRSPSTDGVVRRSACRRCNLSVWDNASHCTLGFPYVDAPLYSRVCGSAQRVMFRATMRSLADDAL